MPPLDRETAAAYAVASIDGVGPVAFHRIASVNAAAGRSFEAFLALSRARMIREYNLSSRLVDAIRSRLRLETTLDRLRRLERSGIRLLMRDADAYPCRLRERLGAQAPSFLFARGDVSLLSSPCVAVVGTRRPTPWGVRCAQALSRAIAGAGEVVVSGFAPGIDRAAHEAAIESGGRTLLVLSYGIVGYQAPDALRGAGRRAAEKDGRLAVVSQFAPWQRFSTGTAMARNRVVAALARAIVAVETGRRGGTIETARMALELERPLFTVRKSTLQATPDGNRELLRRGALALPARERGEKTEIDCGPLLAADEVLLASGQMSLPIDGDPENEE